ncbi:MAG: cupin domain-containing protein [Labilithrix sp.]|nr:cupin domain-containing protein [Labilithrix sp.]MCW5814670.1 cupin domain-containing protein [Labilithrix sp.]
MKSCRVASIVAIGAVGAAGIVEACGGDRPAAPPVVAAPAAADKDKDKKEEDALEVAFFEGRTKLGGPPCSRLFIVAAKGTVTLADDVLKTGDVMIIQYPDDLYADADGLALRVVQPFACSLRDKPGPVVSLRRAHLARELTWAGGRMHAHLDVGADVSPDLYLGRLEGTAAVGEHRHETSAEILVAIEAAGTFTIDGKASRLGPRQIVTVPKDTPHAWTPDPGTNLVAVQLYAPPGPERRFLMLDAAERDAGAPKGWCDPPFAIDANGHRKYHVGCPGL